MRRPLTIIAFVVAALCATFGTAACVSTSVAGSGATARMSAPPPGLVRAETWAAAY